MPVLDSERRKSHIDLIDPTHALLPTALSCLSYLEKDRPSAQDLCRQLATIKETPRYMQLAHLRERNEEQGQQIQQLHQQLQTIQQELQTKDERLLDSQRRTHTLQQELQDRQRQIQQLTHQVEEKQHTIDDRETQLHQLNGQLQANEQVTAELQRNLLQHEQTNSQLRRDLQQAVEEKQAGERQLQELTQRLQVMQVGVATPPQKALVQQKTIRDMKWQKECKAPEDMFRGSATSDSNMAYFNGCRSTKVYSYDSDTQKWRQLPDTPHTWYTTLVVVQHILTTVGGYVSGKVTNSLLSLMGEGGAIKWLPHTTQRCPLLGATLQPCAVATPSSSLEGWAMVATTD